MKTRFFIAQGTNLTEDEKKEIDLFKKEIPKHMKHDAADIFIFRDENTCIPSVFGEGDHHIYDMHGIIFLFIC